MHWVGDTTLIEEDDENIFWTWEMDGYHGYVQDNYGQWFETDGHGKAQGSHLPLNHLGSHLPLNEVGSGANVTLG